MVFNALIKLRYFCLPSELFCLLDPPPPPTTNISNSATKTHAGFCNFLYLLFSPLSFSTFRVKKIIEQMHLLWPLQQVFKDLAQRQRKVGSKIAMIFLFLEIISGQGGGGNGGKNSPPGRPILI